MAIYIFEADTLKKMAELEGSDWVVFIDISYKRTANCYFRSSIQSLGVLKKQGK